MSDPERDLRDFLSASANSPIDPIALARRDLKRALPRRFYTEVAIGQVDEGFGVLLDGKPVRTPAKAYLAVPTAALAESLAAEWRAQGDIIEPDGMPMTRLANSAIDGVSAAIEPTAAEIAKYAETDLVCYRADTPVALVESQSAAWDPVLAFARQDLGARFICAEGVMYVAQPATALAAVRRAVDDVVAGGAGVFRLAALSIVTNITGSVLLALAFARDVMPVEAVWTAAHVDEDYQMRVWGADHEALNRRERRRRDLDTAAKVYRLIAQ